MFICCFWISEQTAIIFLYSINCVVFITETECVYCAVRTESLSIKFRFKYISVFWPQSVFMCFVWIWQQTSIIYLYVTNCLVFITETECVYCAVRTGYLNVILLSTRTLYLCVLCGYQQKQRLYPYTALIDWFYKRDGVCLLRGTDWVFIYNSGLNKYLCSGRKVCLCVLCGSENKQQLFIYTVLTFSFL